MPLVEVNGVRIEYRMDVSADLPVVLLSNSLSTTSQMWDGQMEALVDRSQDATGALQATQAGNQLLALQAQQLSDLTAVIAANGRAQALTDAERAAAAEQGRVQRERFLTPGSGYQPGNAQMFNTGGN